MKKKMLNDKEMLFYFYQSTGKDNINKDKFMHEMSVNELDRIFVEWTYVHILCQDDK
jgi:hypothetical protein